MSVSALQQWRQPWKYAGCSTLVNTTYNRKRRIKCDETRPACVKCVQAGWKCDGYAPQSLATSDRIAAVTTSPTAALSITSYSIPFTVPGSQKDRRLLHYFCVQGSDDISGFLSSGFWSQTVLQESHRDHAVRQALVSLSSLHLDYVTADAAGNGVARVETLEQYGRAIRVLGKRLATPSRQTMRVALICCIIFYCCESTLGNKTAALQHLDKGLKLLPSYYDQHNEEDVADMESLVAMFERLDLQATLFDDDRVPCLTLAPDERTELGEGGYFLKGGFARLEDAQRSLVKLQNHLFRFRVNNIHLECDTKGPIPPVVLQENSLLVQQFELWKREFDGFCSRAVHDEQAEYGIQTLLVHFHVSHMLAVSNSPINHAVFGVSPNASARVVVELAEKILRRPCEQNAKAPAAKNPRRNFSSETGIVAPLFLLAMKCSDEVVCSRAAELLTTSERREGLYDAQTMAEILNKLRVSREQRLYDEIEGITKPRGALEDWLLEGSNHTKGGMDRLANHI
ncbi:hypothetical protein NM208_g5915 [Fusarium decemcellulare]|uniref:Uncharacterized protein n=1 Tax=Fusarium decemcellulare TaxID=57161 RepID=A0ACC1SF34_9HYPO|nr:hypothetical protein NM208_g5915 [Fusarium decemcellulare]